MYMGGDINNDGTGTNDLLYVPTDAEINNTEFDPYSDVFGVNRSADVQKTALKITSFQMII